MINQIAPISHANLKASAINKGLIQARHIQAKLKSQNGDAAKPESGILLGPNLAGPFLVPILRWIE